MCSSFFIGTAGEFESYGHVSVSSCSPKVKVPNGLLTIELSLGSTYYVCLNGFDRGAAAAVCRQLGYVDAVLDPVAGVNFFGPSYHYGYVHHFTYH